jgi:hypothetical protein
LIDSVESTPLYRVSVTACLYRYRNAGTIACYDDYFIVGAYLTFCEAFC